MPLQAVMKSKKMTNDSGDMNSQKNNNDAAPESQPKRRDGDQRVSRYPARARRFRERDAQDALNVDQPPLTGDASEFQDGAGGYAFEDVISGALDTAEDSGEVIAPKRVLQPHVDAPKLHKLLAQARY